MSKHDEATLCTAAQVIPFDSGKDLAIAGDCAPLLEVPTVEAVCRSIHETYFAPFRQQKYVFDFTVISPDKYAGQKLQMFVRIDSRWKTPPSSSKLFKAACVARGTRLTKGDRITQAMFVHKVFRCRLSLVGEGAAA